MSTWAKQYALVFFVGFIALALAFGYSLMAGEALFSQQPSLAALRNAGFSFMAAGMALWVIAARNEAGKTTLNPLFALLTIGGSILSVLSIFVSTSDVGLTPSLGGLGLNLAALIIGLLTMIVDPAYAKPLNITWPGHRDFEESPHHAEHSSHVEEHVIPSAHKDDLAQLEGIGPQIRRILFNAGILTFADLAARTPEELAQIVRNANFKAPFDSTSWPQQARLAVAGDWEALDILREELRAGRAPKAPPPQPDDLTRIEGIGPRINELLHQAGILTFADLAARTPDELTAILKAADFKAPFDPSSWPAQAALAAQGDWEALAALQDNLVGGRDVSSPS